jgi:hypothetical protein
MERTELARETANKLSRLLIARRDVKAFESRGEWFASKSKMTLGDFETHLFGKKCMGTYLLNQKSEIKFIAFDIDLTGPGAYFVIRDLDEVEQMEANGEYVGELDPDHRHGMWDEALHDPDHEGYRWVRSALRHVTMSICEKVDAMLGLPTLPVITGGGAHIIVPFGDKVPASEGRAAAHGVMDGMYGFRRLSDNFYSNSDEDAPQEPGERPLGETMSIEVFPKQDQLPSPDSFGNLIRLPFGWHGQAKMRTYIMDTTPGKLPPWELPKRKSVEALDDALDRLGLLESASD